MKIILLKVSYVFLAVSLLFLFYLHQFYVGPGFMLALLCTLPSEKNNNTILVAVVCCMSPVFYLLIHAGDETISTAAPLLWLIASSGIATMIVLFIKNINRNDSEKSMQQLNEANEKVKVLNDLKSGFITIASHEFRTPLSTILSSADLLEQYNTPGEAFQKRERHIHRIKGAVGGIKSILEHCLSMGKMEDGSFRVVMQPVQPAVYKKEVEEIIRDMQQMAKPGQQINLDMQLNRPPVIDRVLFRDILQHLLSNALKFSPDPCCICVRIRVDDMMSIAVQDVGIGISPEDQRHLFQRFYRASNAGNIQGTGLGLHIVSKYVELMKGKINITSNINEGTTLTVSIPQIHLPSMEITVP